MAYRTIVADPPWSIAWAPSPGRRRKGDGQGLVYPTMTVEEIAALPVASLAADDALLFLWSTRSLFREGIAAQVARAWGFEPCGEILWGLRNAGLGGATGNGHEPALIARRGSATPTAPLPLGVVWWRQPYAKGKIHSAKPEGFLNLVEAVSPGPRVEMFARRNRLGWDTWGDQALQHVNLAL